MSNKKIQKSSLQFLKDIEANNNREWFSENKPKYQEAWKDMGGFMEFIIDEISHFDEIEGNKAKVFRIYKDVRFSKDKTPYKSHFSASMARASKLRRGGYYFHVKPGGKSLVGGGFYNPEKEDLFRIRKAIQAEPERLRDIIGDKKFIEIFGELGGAKLKTAPRGFPKDDPAIDLLRYKSMYAMKNFSDKEVLADDFLEKAMEIFKAIRPFFDYMTEILTTDANGEVNV